MRKIKIMEGFFGVKKIGSVKRLAKKIVKESNFAEAEVVVEDAYGFYMNPAYRSKKVCMKRRPQPGDKMVVIYYKEKVGEVKKVKRNSVKKVVEEVKKIVDVVMEKAIEVVKEVLELRSAFVRMMPVRKGKRKASVFSPSMLMGVIAGIQRQGKAKGFPVIIDPRLRSAA